MKLVIECPLDHKVSGNKTAEMTANPNFKLTVRGLADLNDVGSHIHTDPIVFTCPVGGESFEVEGTITRRS